MKSGIYKIQNNINGKLYVGKSYNIKNRWNKHKYELKNNKHHSEHLQRAWNKYGKENFIFKTIVHIRKPYLLKAEQYWIDYYKSYNYENGYNSRRRAGSTEEAEIISKECNFCGGYFKGKKYMIKNRIYCSPSCSEKSEERANKISKKHKELMKDEEYKKRKLSNLDPGNFTKEHRKKLSKSQEGKNNNMYGVNGEDSPNNSLRSMEVINIQILFNNTNLTYYDLADIFDVCSTTVGNICRGQTWSHIHIKHQEGG